MDATTFNKQIAKDTVDTYLVNLISQAESMVAELNLIRDRVGVALDEDALHPALSYLDEISQVITNKTPRNNGVANLSRLIMGLM